MWWNKHLPVISHIEGVEALCEALHIIRTDLLQKVNVIFRVKSAHVMLGGFVWFENLENQNIKWAFKIPYDCANGLFYFLHFSDKPDSEALPSFSCKGHSAGRGCVSERDDGVSLGDPHLHIRKNNRDLCNFCEHVESQLVSAASYMHMNTIKPDIPLLLYIVLCYGQTESETLSCME